MKLISLAAAAVVMCGLAACTTHDQEKVREDAHKAEEDAKRAGHEIKQEAKQLSQRVGEVVQPDSRSAADKLAQGTDKVKNATANAGAKLDHAALVAEVKAKLAADAGLSTITTVNVEADGGVVTLSGTVRTEEQKKAVEVAAEQVEGVVRVHNSLIVQP